MQLVPNAYVQFGCGSVNPRNRYFLRSGSDHASPL